MYWRHCFYLMYWGVCFVLSTVVSPGLSCVCGLGPFLTIFSLQTAGTVNMSGIITNVPFCCPVKTITLKKKECSVLSNAITTRPGTHQDLRLMQRFMQSIMKQQQ